MTKHDKHPTRKELLEALNNKNDGIRDHLLNCGDCNMLFQILKNHTKQDSPAIIKPDEDSLIRFSAIPLISQAREGLKRIKGALVFDSWEHIPANQLRDISPGFTRRFCMAANKIKLEIIAERQQYEWEFMGRVYDSENVSMEWVLRAGGKLLYPKLMGFYQWNSRKRPHRLELINNNQNIKFEKLSWA